MGPSGHRFRAAPLVVGLAFCVASACGGAASTALDHPPSGPSTPGNDSSVGPADAGGSSSGSGEDATLDDSNPGDFDGGGSSGDDGGMYTDPGGPDASSMCGACMPGTRCCERPGTLFYGQCYSVLCGPCCF